MRVLRTFQGACVFFKGSKVTLRALELTSHMHFTFDQRCRILKLNSDISMWPVIPSILPPYAIYPYPQNLHAAASNCVTWFQKEFQPATICDSLRVRSPGRETEPFGCKHQKRTLHHCVVLCDWLKWCLVSYWRCKCWTQLCVFLTTEGLR